MEVLRILMVDDSADDLELFGRTLRQSREARIELVTARDSHTALEHLLNNPTFDVILLDHNMPGRSGLELLHEWTDAIPDLPAVILLTGHGGERVAVDAMKGGAFDYLSKHDVSTEELGEAVRRAAYITRLRKALADERGQRASLELQVQQALHDGEISGIRRTIATFMHEINSPLTGIIGYSRMLLEDDNIEDRHSIYAEILAACHRVEEVLQSMEALDASQVKSTLQRTGLVDLRCLL